MTESENIDHFFIFESYSNPTRGLQQHVRKHFSSIKAVLLYKPLNQYSSATHTENSFSFTDIIKEYMVGNIQRIFSSKSVF